MFTQGNILQIKFSIYEWFYCNINRIECCCVNASSSILICGHSDGIVSFRRLWDLSLIRELNEIQPRGSITYLGFTSGIIGIKITCFVSTYRC